MPTKTMKGATVADAYLQLLADRGIDFFFANAGTDFAPIIEAFAKAQALGTPTPVPVTCPHENTAVHMAIGYYMVTGRPQAVMVHVNVGTANALNGILNAKRGQVPVFVTAGRTPLNEESELPGHRSLDIHWTQEMFDQGGMVREAVKWDYELRNGQQLEAVVDRALTVSMTEPRGPIYLSLPREVLAAPLDTFEYASPTRQHPAAAAAPNPNATDEAAALLAKAENPIILTGAGGRTPAAFNAISEFAERFAIPVLQHRYRILSVPTDHPMNLGYSHDGWVAEADVILVIDTAAPYVPAQQKLQPDARVIHLGPDPLHSYVPIRGIPCDIALACGTAEGLTTLANALDGQGATERVERRRAAVAVKHAALRETWTARLQKVRGDATIHPAWLSHCISEVKGDDAIVIQESKLLASHMRFTKPLTLFNPGAASGLGHGLGAALGAKLAAPDRLVIGTHGDGAYMFGNPLSSHYVGAEQGLPVLSVIFNNQRWQAVRSSTLGVVPDGYASKSNRQPLTHLDSISHYEKVVEAADGYGEHVTDPEEVLPALERGLRAVTVERRQAVLNVICSVA